MEEIELHSYLKVETAKGRTYGECVMDEIASIKMINGGVSHYLAHQRETQTVKP